jgi:hypothetical protein
MKRTIPPVCFVLILALQALPDCIASGIKSTSLDTTGPGVVEVTRCYYQLWTAQGPIADTCSIDTSYEQDLLDSLKAEYTRTGRMMIGHIDSVASIPESIWIEDLVQESVHVVIDSTLKGAAAVASLWLTYRGYCTDGCGILINRPFVSFFDSISTISSIGVDPGHFSEPAGYFLAGGKITSASFPGVSIRLDDFLSAMTSSIRPDRKAWNHGLSRHNERIARCARTAFLELNGRIPGVRMSGRLPAGVHFVRESHGGSFHAGPLIIIK